jgi:2-oxoglutarate ferredoxin oxidoreductase subunit beta
MISNGTPGSASRCLAITCFMHAPRVIAWNVLERGRAGEIVTGLICVDPQPVDMHANLGTIPSPLNQLGDEICPGAAALDKINASYR